MCVQEALCWCLPALGRGARWPALLPCPALPLRVHVDLPASQEGPAQRRPQAMLPHLHHEQSVLLCSYIEQPHEEPRRSKRQIAAPK